MERFILILLALFSFGILISYLVSRFISNIFIRLLPSIFGLLVMFYLYLKLRFTPMDGFADLGYFMMGIMTCIVVFGNAVGVLLWRKKKRKFQE